MHKEVIVGISSKINNPMSTKGTLFTVNPKKRNERLTTCRMIFTSPA
jgi:hypothetical protein